MYTKNKCKLKIDVKYSADEYSTTESSYMKNKCKVLSWWVLYNWVILFERKKCKWKVKYSADEYFTTEKKYSVDEYFITESFYLKNKWKVLSGWVLYNWIILFEK